MPLDDQTVLTLRRDIYGKERATKADLARLIDMNRTAGVGASRAFVDLLNEVAADVLLNDVDPPKYIQPADADWLMARLSGGLAGGAERDMLTHVIRNAVSVPPVLAAFAVGEIERGIVSASADRAPVGVSHHDIEALRVVVYAATEGSSLHVTRESAEALFRIADATAGAKNDPAFDAFFARAIGNYLMGIAFRWTLPAGESRRADDWLDAPAQGLGQFVKAMFDRDRLGDHDAETVDAAQNAADAQARAHAEKIDAAEADWLVARLHRDGVISEAEKSLLRFLGDESPTSAPALAALIDKAA